jgi:hypothetical protein
VSLIQQAYAVPSRIQGIYRYLLRAKDQRDRIDVMERLFMPDPLLDYSKKEDPRAPFRENVREGLRLRLFGEIKADPDDRHLTLHEDLPVVVRDPKEGEEHLRFAIADLVLLDAEGQNDNLAYALAWYLAQDPYGAPATKYDLPLAIKNHELEERTNVTSGVTIDQFAYWSVYLGFAWQHHRGDETVLTPDPTVYLRRALPYLFTERGETQSLPAFMARLADRAPIFEGGRFRDEIEQVIGGRDENHLSPCTALALLRLREEGDIELEKRSDINLRVFPEHKERHRFTHITWK